MKKLLLFTIFLFTCLSISKYFVSSFRGTEFNISLVINYTLLSAAILMVTNYAMKKVFGDTFQKEKSNQSKRINAWN
jgi:hypothetical protein